MNEWLERARGLAPLVEELRDQGEAERHLPKPIVKAMRQADLFSMWVPRDLGGAELDVATVVQVTEELARQDGSVGWNSMIAGNTAVLWAFFAPEAAREMMKGDPNTIIAGTILAGSGTATPVPGGYRISGRWPFASGCHQADWLVSSCAIVEDGQPRLGPDGTPERYTFGLPISDCEILDTWYTTGMRGTGSHDFQVTDVFVPEERVFPSVGAHPYYTGPLYNTPVPVVWGPNVTAVALGIARAAIDSFIELAVTKRPSRSTNLLAERETVQEKVGQAESLLRSGRAFLFESIRDTWASLSAGRQLTPEEMALNRLATATAVQNAVQAVDIVFTAAGSSSIYTRSRIERCFRDVHMVTQHGVVGPAGFAVAGRCFLGLGFNR